MTETNAVCGACGHDDPHEHGTWHWVRIGGLQSHTCHCTEQDRTIAALRARIAELEDSVTWQRRRLDMLQREQKRMRDPERTIVCDILANGALLPDPSGTRYGTLDAALAEAARKAGE